MAGNDIRQKIVLDGEKEYNQALSEARRNLKTLRSELKAETAELGANATAQQKNEVKVKSLQKQIKEQEKVVKTYKAALEEVKDKYSDNQDAIAKWEQKLNDARATLATMKNGLDETSKSMKSVGDSAQMGVVAANSFADSLGKIAEAGGMISGALENAFKSVVSVISTAIGDVWADVLEIASKADNYLDLASFLGSSATDVQKWSKAMNEANGDISSVVSLISRLKYGGKADKVTEWFGLSGENYTDDLEYFTQLMSIAVKERDKMVEAGTWDEAMSEIFGAKKVQDFENILSDWTQIAEALKTYDPDEGGFGLTEDQIEQMAELEQQVSRLEEKWKALKEMATVSLTANLAMQITGNLENIIDAFKEYFEATDDEGREAALQKIEENIVSIIEAVRDGIQRGLEALEELADQFKGSGDSTVQAIGNVLGGIVDTLQWFAEPSNWEAVKIGFETLIGIWAFGKIASAVGNLASFAAHITTIKTAMGGGGLFGGLSGGGGGGSVLTSAGYLAVGLMMVAPTVAKLFDPKTWETPETPELPEAGEAVKQAGISNQDLLRYGFNNAFFTGGDTSGLVLPNGKEKEEEQSNGPESTNGVVIPRAVKKFELTTAQMAAAEQVWDNWRLMKFGNGSEYSFDKAWENFEKAFEGDEATFNRLNDMMDKLMQSLDENGADGLHDYQDLPSSWWMNNGQDNGITSEDLHSFYGLPAQMAKAVANGAAAGVSGITVNLDGQKVGVLVAPYVSQEIARDIP